MGKVENLTFWGPLPLSGVLKIDRRFFPETYLPENIFKIRPQLFELSCLQFLI